MKTIAKFIVAGGVGFVVDFSLLNLMLWFRFSPITGRLISFSAAVIFTFVINRNFTFRNKGKLLTQFQSYIIGSLLGLCMNWVIYYFSLSYFSPQLSIFIASTLAMIINFSFYRFVVFKR